MDLLTIGESLGVFAASRTGPLRVGGTSSFTFAGAESNVAIGMSRLGHSCAWLGRLGDDAVGQAIRTALRGESVDLGAVVTDPEAATALLVREFRTHDRVRVSYHRRHSAGSRLEPGDVDPELVRSARLLHVTGITPALSESASAAVRSAVETAQEAGVPVSFDVNYRSRLWTRPEAAAGLNYLLKAADVVFAGLDEALLFTGGDDPGDDSDAALSPVLTQLASRTKGDVVLKLGATGSAALVDGVAYRDPPVPVTSVDTVGAGDAFVAGYLSAYLAGLDVPARLHRGGVCGAFAVSSHGDWEGAPHLADLHLLAGDDVVR